MSSDVPGQTTSLSPIERFDRLWDYIAGQDTETPGFPYFLLGGVAADAQGLSTEFFIVAHDNQYSSAHLKPAARIIELYFKDGPILDISDENLRLYTSAAVDAPIFRKFESLILRQKMPHDLKWS